MGIRSDTLRLVVTASTLWPFVPIAARAPQYGRLMLELIADGRVPLSRKVLLGVAGAYVASPIDLIPDAIPFISRLDDVAVVVVAVDLFFEGVPRELMIEKMYALGIDGRELERDLESFRKFVPEPIRVAARRLPAVIDAGTALIRRELETRGILRPG